MVTRLDINDPGFEDAFNRLLGAKRETETDVDDVVAGILADVRARGDEAVLGYTKEFDGFDLSAADMRVTGEEISAASEASDPAVLDALRLAARRIADFHCLYVLA